MTHLRSLDQDCVEKGGTRTLFAFLSLNVGCFHGTEIDEGGSLGARGRRVICKHTSLSLQPLPLLACILTAYSQATHLSHEACPGTDLAPLDVLHVAFRKSAPQRVATFCSLRHAA